MHSIDLACAQRTSFWTRRREKRNVLVLLVSKQLNILVWDAKYKKKKKKNLFSKCTRTSNRQKLSNTGLIGLWTTGLGVIFKLVTITSSPLYEGATPFLPHPLSKQTGMTRLYQDLSQSIRLRDELEFANVFGCLCNSVVTNKSFKQYEIIILGIQVQTEFDE